MRRLLGEVMIRNTRAQSGLKLPPRYVTTVRVDPLAEERALYEAVIALLRANAGEPRARRAASTLLLEAGSSPHAVCATLERMRDTTLRGLDEIATRARKIDAARTGQALVDLVAAHAKEQILVFTRYRATLSWIDELLARAGVSRVLAHGGLDSADKEAAFERFRGEARVLVTDVGSEGHNLQHCHVLLNFDLPWNPMAIEQRIGRLHRFGQREAVQVYKLCAAETVEDRMLDVLDRRVRLFELVVGETDMVLGNLADERDLEERLLQLYAEAESDGAIARGFDTLADELLRARGHYEKVKALDESLFGKEFEA